MISHVLMLATWFGLGARAEPPEPIEVPPVHVRGDRHGDSTAPSTVIPRAHLQEIAVQDLPSVLDEQPSLRISRLGGLGSFATVSVRGSSAEQVLLTLDGIPLNAADGGPVDLSLLPLGPLERVEVYRGMAPLELGASAIGGAIGLVTRAPRRPVLELEVGGGSFGTRLMRTFVGVGSRRASASFALDYMGSQGDFEFTNDHGTLLGGGAADDTVANRQNADFDQVSALFRGAVPLGLATLRVTDLLSYRGQGLPGIGLFTTESARLETVRNLLGVAIDARDLGDLDGRFSVTPYTTVTRVRLEDPLGEIGLATPDTTRDRLWSIGSRLLGSFEVPVSDIVVFEPRLLAEYRYEVFEPTDALTRGAPSYRHIGLAGGEVRALFEPANLELVVGARGEWLTSDLTARSVEPGEARFQASSEVQDTSWRAAAVWSGVPGLSIRASASQSLRPPSLFELFGNTGAVLGSPALVPERATTGDLGAVWTPSDLGSVTLSGELYGFVTRAADLIALVQNGQYVAQAKNVQSAWLYGAELGFRLEAPHFRSRLSATWLGTENTSDIAAERGNRLPHRPEWKGFLRLEGHGQAGVGLRGAIELEVLGSNFVDAANTTYLDERVWLGVTFGITFFRELDLSLDLANVLDVPAEDLVGYPLPGFRAMASLRWTPFVEKTP